MSEPGRDDPAPSVTQAGLRTVARRGGLEAVQELCVTDIFGEERHGAIFRLAHWSTEATRQLPGSEDGFRIVLLEEAPPRDPKMRDATVLCVPEASPARAAEAALQNPTPSTEQRWPLRAEETKRLARGRFIAPVELLLTPAEIFSGATPRFDILAGDLVLQEATAHTFGLLAMALSAPRQPAQREPTEWIKIVRQMTERTASSRDQLPAQAGQDLERLERLSSFQDVEGFLREARQLFPEPEALAEAVFTLRALDQWPTEALQVLAMQQALLEAAVPMEEGDLAMDHAIVERQLQFASLVPEPNRLQTATTALEHFRSRFRQRYALFHGRYWEQAASLAARLEQAIPLADAVMRLNSLAELGPPVGESTLRSYWGLLEEIEVCGEGSEGGELAESALICPQCRLALGAEPPSRRAEDALARLGRALEQHMRRLSSVTVRQVLEGCDDARIERFLRVVRASQLSSLVEILDDALVGYLRRYLAEARIGAVLEPLLIQVQRGESPGQAEARQALHEIATIVERALRGSQRQLPPGKRQGERDGEPEE